jgi:F-type H+-transporting ATPase subunit epsilon
MTISFQLDIVSAEAEIFSGLVEQLFVSGVMGDMEIMKDHAPLLTMLKPSPIWIVRQNSQQDIFYISGGMLVVQKKVVILADTAVRAKDVDETHALEAKKRALAVLEGHSKEFDFVSAQTQLMEALAQLKALKKLRERSRH